jgi:hypothetical protein
MRRTLLLGKDEPAAGAAAERLGGQSAAGGSDAARRSKRGTPSPLARS